MRNIVFEGVSMETGGHNPQGVDHFAEASTATEQLQSHLRVRDVSKGLQDTESFSDSGLSVAVAEMQSSHRPPYELEVSIPYDLDISGQLANIDRRRSASSRN